MRDQKWVTRVVLAWALVMGGCLALSGCGGGPSATPVPPEPQASRSPTPAPTSTPMSTSTPAMTSPPTPVPAWGAQEGRIAGLAFSSDGALLASHSHREADGSGYVIIREVKTGQAVYEGEVLGGHVAFSGDLGLILSNEQVDGSSSQVEIAQVKTGERKNLDVGTWGDMALSPDGKSAIAGLNEITYGFFDLTSGRKSFGSVGFQSKGSAMSKPSADGNFVAIAGQGKVLLMNISQQRAVFQHVPTAGGAEITNVALSPDHALIAFGQSLADKGAITIVDTGSGDLIFHQEGDAVSAVKGGLQFSPDGRVLYSLSTANLIQAWEVGTGQMVNTYKPEQEITCLAASPDGQTLAFGTDGQGVFLLDLTAGQ
jgi:WD40 repeat protein